MARSPTSSLRWGRLFFLALIFLCFSLTTSLAQKTTANAASTVTEEKNDLFFMDDEEFEEELDEFDRFLQDSATSSTRVNIWQKLKESLGLTIVGCILICCAPLLIWKNEGRHVRELVRIDFAKKAAIEVECNSAGDETLGQLVHFTGPVSVGDAFLDFGSGGEAKGTLDLVEPLPQALILKRTCYIWQKFEDAQNSVQKDTIGGGETRQTTYTMREGWATTPQPAQLEHLPAHTNSRGIWDSLLEAAVNSQDDGSGPGMLPEGLPEGMAEKMGLVDTSKKPHGIVVAPSAAVGFFGLSRKIILENMPQFGSETVPVPADHLPNTVEGCDGLLKGSDNVMRNFPEGAEPFNGAVKVVFEYVTDGFDCSFVVQQIPRSGEGAATEQPTDEEMAKFGVDRAMVEGKCSRDDYGDIWMVRRGRLTLEEMVSMAKEDEGKIVKLMRIVGWIALMAGWTMLFSPFTTALSTLPILGGLGNFAVGVVALIVSCTCFCTVMVLAYIRYRPLLAFGLLALALGIWGIIAWRLNDAAENGGDTTTSSAYQQPTCSLPMMVFSIATIYLSSM